MEDHFGQLRTGDERDHFHAAPDLMMDIQLAMSPQIDGGPAILGHAWQG